MDTLQSVFSRTYRYNIEQHQQFHNLGKYLKILVNVFGECANQKSLYHGISEKLSFTMYGIGIDKISAQGPLSTTLALPVAANFAAVSNEGLIMQFEPNFSPGFDASWVSDYAAEKEYLFIQMNPQLRGLSIKDVIDTHMNVSYGILLNALKYISNLLESLSVNVNDSPLISMIIEHQLSVHFSQHKSILSLTEYGKQICNTYFAKQKKIIIDLNCLMKEHKLLCEMLFDLQQGIIHLNKFNVLYPNVSTIKCQSILIEASIAKYKSYFKQRNLLIYDEKDTIYIVRMNEMEMHFNERAIDSLLCFGMKEHSFPRDPNIFCKLDNAIKTLVNSKESSKVRQLNELGKFVFTVSGQKKKDIVWDWSAIVSKRKSCLFEMFCCENCSWINIPEIINRLWPDLQIIEILEINLSNDVIKTILIQLKAIRNKCSLKRITIFPWKDSELDIDQAITEYQNKFRCMNCSLFKSFGSFTILLKLADSFDPLRDC